MITNDNTPYNSSFGALSGMLNASATQLQDSKEGILETWAKILGKEAFTPLHYVEAD